MTPDQKANAACRDVVERVPGALICAVMDSEGSYVASARGSDATAAETARDALGRCRQLLNRQHLGALDRDAEAGDPEALRELHLSCPRWLYFIKCVAGGRYYVALATEPSTKLGIAWAMLRGTAAAVEEDLAGAKNE